MSINNQAEVRGVLLPLSPVPALLPNVAIAEIIGWREPEAMQDVEAWFAGLLEWRHHLIPIVDMSAAHTETNGSHGARTRIAICNTLNGNKKLPFIGLVVEEIPHLVKVNANNLLESEDSSGQGLPGHRLRLDDEEVVIPDLDWLEKEIESQLSSSAG
ncbi:MAG: chemotaxis protein CheW [gamma proteobacterium symbiont of Bathyaustriella thionipta]|nr:chemotaxis protein CheW [gamma proteobacterium symbiont of Bathyaustriella thionipta]